MDKQIVTIIPKPDVVRRQMLGSVIMAFENRGLTLVSTVQKIALCEHSLRDTYNIIGLDLTEEEEKEWGMSNGKTDPVFSFLFEADTAHAIIDEMRPHKIFPVMYIKRK